MEELLQQIEAYRKEIEGYKISNPQQLEEFRIRFLGTKGITKSLFGEMKRVPNEKKKEFGQVLNDFKQLLILRRWCYHGVGLTGLRCELGYYGTRACARWLAPARAITWQAFGPEILNSFR